MNLAIPILFAVLFLFVIGKSRFFKINGISSVWIQVFFILKIFSGIALTLVYTHLYTDPKTSDVLLYFNDGKIIADAFRSNPLDGIRLLTGVNNNDPQLFENYISKMQRWSRTHDFFFINDCRTIIRFDAIVQLISFGVFHAGTVIMSFLSLIGLVALFRAFRPYFNGKIKLLILALIFSPSLLFWSSALLKEGLLIFCIGILTFSALRIFRDRKKDVLTIFIFSLSILASLLVKPYFFILLLPAAFSFLLVHHLKFKFVFVLYSSIYLLFILLFFAVSLFFLNRNPVKELVRYQHDFLNLAKGGIFLYRDSTAVWMKYEDQINIIKTSKKDTVMIRSGSNYHTWNSCKNSDTIQIKNSTDTSLFWLSANIPPAGSAYSMPHLNYSFSSFLSYVPSAILNVFLRPYPFECQSLQQRICLMENLFFFILLFGAFFFISPGKLRYDFFLMGCFFVFTLFLLIGFTTPVTGAIVRYKAPALPFLLAGVFSLVDVEKLGKTRILKFLVDPS